MTQSSPAVAGPIHVDPEEEPPALAGQSVTLVEGSTFAVSGRSGDMSADGPEGLFFRDVRLLSTWRLRLDDRPLQVLAVLPQEPFRTAFLGRVPPQSSSTELLVERRRYVGEGMREDLRVRNLGMQTVATRLRLDVDSDFADVFAVKEGRVQERGEVSVSLDGDTIVLGFRNGALHLGVRISATSAQAHRGGLAFDLLLPPHSDWETTVMVTPVVDGEEVEPTFPVGLSVEESHPAQRLRHWRARTPGVETDDVELLRTLRQSMEDLGALRLFDPEDPDTVAVAAGAPWFMALFGRDSLLSSYMALPLDPTLALGTMRTLARLQGTQTEPRTEEQPGRILHETRLGADFPLTRGGGNVYYGTADATPLFVVLLGELRRWSIASEQVDALLPHADRALAWIEQYGDRDGDGFVEYQRSTEVGLVHQGWKDSWDGVNFADGTLAETPIALCEVQAYVYSAYVARSHFAYVAGDDAATERWAAKADALKAAFNERFWLPDRGWFAIALDGAKRQVDALTSNIGHCLWTGIVDEDKAARVAEHLMSPEMFTGWGVRTLASSMGRFNPMSYHNGSVWPHDSVLVATGLMRYGFVEEAQRIGAGLLDAATEFGGRLPELFCGFDRSEYPSPIPYPTSCSPQAWAAASPIQVMRMLLRLEPRMPRGEVWFDPAWPARYGRLRIRDLPLGGHRVTLVIDGDRAELDGLPEGVRVIRSLRTPLQPARPERG
ncbi:glycogen debranching N-terminal domain-containing protein [Geodermatophilus ruber]|uniref:Glycogen debranching enzyme (Alpha-1,6-glucosidase) n=1 Tax=Geodermatophilus ruber TaxID=504800 RepID=A0A1I4GPA8_9ACTN|nr:glycogen debranching N-terminal domain-containing protein [Geodermatophilus ruber]SFL31864.1 Glycogen debranching enzyme (alpha-1,6-glucosidase) [Geodermatophilus ruber]